MRLFSQNEKLIFHRGKNRRKSDEEKLRDGSKTVEYIDIYIYIYSTYVCTLFCGIYMGFYVPTSAEYIQPNLHGTPRGVSGGGVRCELEV